MMVYMIWDKKREMYHSAKHIYRRLGNAKGVITNRCANWRLDRYKPEDFEIHSFLLEPTGIIPHLKENP